MDTWGHITWLLWSQMPESEGNLPPVAGGIFLKTGFDRFSFRLLFVDGYYTI